MGVPAVHVAHAIRGRVRIKIRALKGNAELAREVEERLWEVRHVRSVSTNPVTGSALVHYDDGSGRWAERAEALAATLAEVVPGLDAREAAQRLLAGAEASPGPLRLDAQTVNRFFGTVNQTVETATGGDLRVLLPLALVVLGGGGLLFAQELHLPRWYELLWFGFGAFVMLNAAGVPAGRAAEEAAELAAAL